jgi:protein TonB
MKKPLLILLFLLSAEIAKAQDSITTLKGLAADTALFTVVDEEPRIPRNFGEYLLKNLQTDSAHKTSGVVVLKFVVEKDGSLSNIRVIKSLSPYWDNKAVQILRNSPKWFPGSQGGKIVRCLYNFPIRLAN